MSYNGESDTSSPSSILMRSNIHFEQTASEVALLMLDDKTKCKKFSQRDLDTWRLPAIFWKHILLDK